MKPTFLNNKNTVLLDLDGTLVDSVRAHAESWRQTLGEYGFEVSKEKLERSIGMGGDKLIALTTGLENEELKDQISERRSAIFRTRYLEHVAPVAGAGRLIEELRGRGLTVFLATASSSKDRDALLKQGGLENYFSEFVSPEDVSGSKPEPDLLQAIMDKLGVSSDSCLLIGDSPFDAEAAGRAGMDFVAVETGVYRAPELPQARWVFSSPADLLDTLIQPSQETTNSSFGA